MEMLKHNKRIESGGEWTWQILLFQFQKCEPLLKVKTPLLRLHWLTQLSLERTLQFVSDT